MTEYEAELDLQNGHDVVLTIRDWEYVKSGECKRVSVTFKASLYVEWLYHIEVKGLLEVPNNGYIFSRA